MKYDSIIKSASKEYKIDPNIIRAIISVESSWNPNATRYEKKIDDTSFGLMQILTKTARWVTNNPKITGDQLKSPSLNIMVGTRYLAYLLKKHKAKDSMIASYNAGKPIMSKTNIGMYINQDYVDKVNSAYRKYKSGGVNITPAVLAAVSIAFLLGNN